MTYLYCHTHVWNSCVALCVVFICDMTHPCRPWLILVRLDSFILPQMCVDGLCIAIPEALMWHVSSTSADIVHVYSPTWLMHWLPHVRTHACCHSHVWMVLASPFSFMCNMKMIHVAHEWVQFKNHTRVCGKINESCRIRMSHGLEWVTVMLHMNEGNTRITLLSGNKIESCYTWVSGDKNESCYTWMSHVALASPFTWCSYVTRLIDTDLDSSTCDMTRTFCHAHVWFLRRHSRGVCTWHDSFTSTMTHSCATCMCGWLLHHYVRVNHMWHDTSISTVTHSSVTWLIYIATHTCQILALPFAWRSYVTWHIHLDRDSF